MVTARKVAREYLRVSVDRSGRERSPGEQHDDHEIDAAEHGWTLHPTPYRDVGSASRYARKSRDGYDTLISDLKADKFGADVLVLWEGSRGSRRAGEWVTLADLLEDRGVFVWIHTHERLYDPRNPHDRAALLDDAIKSELSSAETSKRSLRAAKANAKKGKPHGSIRLGYTRRYWIEQDPETGKSKKQFADELHPDEAPLAEELFKRIIRGHSLRAISMDWAQRGILNDSGTPYSPAHLRQILLNPAYAGLRVHDPHRRASRKPASAAATTVKAEWPAIVDMQTFIAARDILTDPTRKTSRPGRAKWQLSMIVKCDVCSGVIVVRFRKDRPCPNGMYWCRNHGHVAIDRLELDEYVEREVIWPYLSRLDVYKPPAEDDGEELKAARDDVAVIKAELKELERDFGAGRVKSAFALAAEAEKNRRLDAAEAREQELQTPSRLAGLIEPGPDVAKRWKDTPMSARREIARILLAPDLIGELRIARAGYRGEPVEDRVRWRRDSPEEL